MGLLHVLIEHAAAMDHFLDVLRGTLRYMFINQISSAKAFLEPCLCPISQFVGNMFPLKTSRKESILQLYAQLF
jgi:hypothetical protein